MTFVYSDKMSSYTMPINCLVLYELLYPCRPWCSSCDISTIVKDMFYTCPCRVLSLHHSTIVIGFYKQDTKIIEFINILKLYKPINISTLIIIMTDSELDKLLSDKEEQSNENTSAPIVGNMKKLAMTDNDHENDGDAKMADKSNLPNSQPLLEKADNSNLPNSQPLLEKADDLNLPKSQPSLEKAPDNNQHKAVPKSTRTYDPDWSDSNSSSDQNNDKNNGHNYQSDYIAGYNALSERDKIKFHRLEVSRNRFVIKQMEDALEFKISQYEYFSVLDMLIKGRPTSTYMSKVFKKQIYNAAIDRLYEAFKNTQTKPTGNQAGNDRKRRNTQSMDNQNVKRAKNSKNSKNSNNVGSSQANDRKSTKYETELKNKLDNLKDENYKKLENEKIKADNEIKLLKSQLLNANIKAENDANLWKSQVLNHKKSELLQRAEKNIYKRRLADSLSNQTKSYSFKPVKTDQMIVSEAELEAELTSMGYCNKQSIKSKIDDLI